MWPGVSPGSPATGAPLGFWDTHKEERAPPLQDFLLLSGKTVRAREDGVCAQGRSLAWSLI